MQKTCQHKLPDLQRTLSKPFYFRKMVKKGWGGQKILFLKVKKWSLSIDVMIQKNHLNQTFLLTETYTFYPPSLIPSTLAVRNFSENCSASFENLQYTIFMQKIQRILKALSEKKWILTTNYGSDPVGPFLTKDQGYKNNKTSIQWTPGSQIDRSNQKIIFSKM